MSLEGIFQKLDTILVNRRSLRHYTNAGLRDFLNETDGNITEDWVQGFWNVLKTKLINEVDKVAPHNDFINNLPTDRPLPSNVRSKIM